MTQVQQALSYTASPLTDDQSQQLLQTLVQAQAPRPVAPRPGSREARPWCGWRRGNRQLPPAGPSAPSRPDHRRGDQPGGHLPGSGSGPGPQAGAGPAAGRPADAAAPARGPGARPAGRSRRRGAGRLASGRSSKKCGMKRRKARGDCACGPRRRRVPSPLVRLNIHCRHDRHHRAALQARLRQIRHRRLQHQQRRADHGPLPGLHRVAGAVHHPDLQGRAQIHRQAHARGDHPRRRGDLSRGDLRGPSRPRRRGDLLRLHRLRLLQLGDDRRLARSVRRERRHHQARRRPRPRQGHFRRGRARDARRRRGGHQGRGRQRVPDRPGRGPATSSRPPAATPSPAPSAPATAPTSSRASSRCIST